MISPGSDAPPTIEGHRHVRRLGGGRSSTVYLYEQGENGRAVAVKVLPGAEPDEQAATRFADEASAMVALGDHPNIVRVLSSGVTAEGRPYLTMSYCPNGSLRERVAQGPLAVAEALDIGIAIAGALEAAHRRARVLHGGIRPANILLDESGTPRLTDFGVAGGRVAAGRQDDPGVAMPWSPPEILLGEPASVACDVYSLAATLWHLIVGRSPFEVVDGDNGDAALRQRILQAPPPPVGRPDVPDGLQRVLDRALAKLPSERPRTARAFAAELTFVRDDAAAGADARAAAGASAGSGAETGGGVGAGARVEPVASTRSSGAARDRPARPDPSGDCSLTMPPGAVPAAGADSSGPRWLLAMVLVAVLAVAVAVAGLILVAMGGDDENQTGLRAPHGVSELLQIDSVDGRADVSIQLVPARALAGPPLAGRRGRHS